jgi:hypothetical protein
MNESTWPLTGVGGSAGYRHPKTLTMNKRAMRMSATDDSVSSKVRKRDFTQAL